VATEAMRTHVQTSLQRTMTRLDPYFQLGHTSDRKFIRKGRGTALPD
jgi:hypothetical protein